MILRTIFHCFALQGFLDLKMRLWLRNLVTRCIAIAPSLIVCIIGGSSGAARLIIIASVRHDLSQTPRGKKKKEFLSLSPQEMNIDCFITFVFCFFSEYR